MRYLLGNRIKDSDGEIGVIVARLETFHGETLYSIDWENCGVESYKESLLDIMLQRGQITLHETET